MQLIDSHAHLDLLEDPQAALTAARQAGVVQIVTIGIDLATSQKAAGFAAQNNDVFFTVGVHPHDAAQADDGVWEELASLARKQGAVAVGECGLDYFRNRSPKQDQRAVFVRQMELARELGLPLVIHDRDAHQETIELLAAHADLANQGVVHCFSGDRAVAKKVLDLGFYMGVTGTVTYPKNDELRKVVAMAPKDRLLMETDCPFLAPQAKRGKPNQPAYLALMIETMAEAMGLSAEETAAVTTANTRRLFGLPETD